MISLDEIVETALWARELDAEERARARRGISERSYPKDAYICSRGERFDYWGGVVSGLVKMSAVTEAGKAITFTGIRSGGWFGEGTILKNEPRGYDIVVVRESRVALMNRATFLWLSENSVGFNRFLVRQLNERLGLFIGVIEQDRALDARARVARHLSWLSHPVLSPGNGPTIDLTQEELALLAGVSRQIVNKVLQDLADDGLIRVEPGRVTMLDVHALGSARI